MKETAPNYYKDFKCIADKCRHSCCVGWEIDIDEDSLDRYRAIEGEMGRRLASCIEENEDGAHFALDANERCPFLNENGLCDLYTALGEDSLCEICTEHPRFRNFFADRTEIGIGLCCEAAAKLILEQPMPFSLVTLFDDGEEEESDDFEEWLISHRSALLDKVWGAGSTSQACDLLLSEEGLCFQNPDNWVRHLQELEQLDPAWGHLLHDLSQADETVWQEFPSLLDRPLRNLLAYFLYRHLAGAQDGQDAHLRVGFACLAPKVISALCVRKQRCTGDCDFNDLLEFARMYSSEIEYSEDNTQALLAIWEETT